MDSNSKQEPICSFSQFCDQDYTSNHLATPSSQRWQRNSCKEQTGDQIPQFQNMKQNAFIRKSFDQASRISRKLTQQTEPDSSTLLGFSNKLKINNPTQTRQIVSKFKIVPENFFIYGQSLSIKKKQNQKAIQIKKTKTKEEVKKISCLEFAKSLMLSKAKLKNQVTQMSRSRKMSDQESNDDEESYQIQVKKSETPNECKDISFKTHLFHKSHSVQPRQEEKSDESYYIEKLYKHKINKVEEQESEEAKLFREHFVQTFAVLQYFNQMNINEQTVTAGEPVNLPKPNQKKNLKTLVLDLDETLIHFHNNSQIKEQIAPYSITVELPNKEPSELLVSFRPGLHYFLDQLSKLYEIVIFTASYKEYAQQILKFFEEQVVQQSGLYDEILARNECQLVKEQFYVKDLRCLLSNDRTLNNIVIVDNACYSFALQLDNGVPCIPYYGGDKDKELYSLLNYLKQLADSDDIREVNKKTFHLSKLVNENNVNSAYEKICKAIEQAEI